MMKPNEITKSNCSECLKSLQPKWYDDPFDVELVIVAGLCMVGIFIMFIYMWLQ